MLMTFPGCPRSPSELLPSIDRPHRRNSSPKLIARPEQDRAELRRTPGSPSSIALTLALKIATES